MSKYIQQLKNIPTATIAYGQNDDGVISPLIKAMWTGIKMVGIAYTVKINPGDNKYVHQAVSVAPKGSVLVVSNGGDQSTAIVGDIIIRNCIKNSLSGFVTDGAMRDLYDCRKLGLPIFASGLCMKGPSKISNGILGEPIELGGVLIETGNFIVGDEDGLVSIKPQMIEEVIKKAVAKEELEEKIISQINNGENTIDIFNLRN